MSLTNYFADALVAEAKKDARIVGIHAAMGGGTGMNHFENVSARVRLAGPVWGWAGLGCAGLAKSNSGTMGRYLGGGA